jgi:hypothetical protein
MESGLTSRGARSRDRIVAAAADLFARGGVNGTSIDDILAPTAAGRVSSTAGGVTTMTGVAMPLASDSDRAADFDGRNVSGILCRWLQHELQGHIR